MNRKWYKFISLTLFLFFAACGGTSSTGSSSSWSAALAVSSVASATVEGTAYNSSSRLTATWTAPSTSVDHFVVTATETIGPSEVVQTVSGTATTVTFTGLKSDTSYDISLSACTDVDCAQTSTPAEGAVTGQTAAEYWQLQGDGASVAELTPAVSDGNSKISAIFYGSDADADLAGKVQLYYGPLGASDKGLAVGLMADPLIDDPASAFIFTSLAGESGLLSPTSATTLIEEVNTGQGVPLSAALGGKIRLFFEANGSDGKARILYLDSQDGYIGQDFNADVTSGICSTTADYGSGGGCAPNVAIGIEGDAVQANTNVLNARQFKVAWPTLDDWRWDGASGTYMVFTVDLATSCSENTRTDGFAVWNGTDWVVQYDETTGCPKFFTSMQAPTSVHLGGASYKLYYGDTSQMSGAITGSQLPYLGPHKVIYADGAVSGDTSVVDFADWENQDDARDLHFLWPSGTEMSETEEGYIDDFMMMAPTQDLDFQVMYMAITDGTVSPTAAGAVLINP